MNISDIGVVIGITMSVAAAGGTAGKYYLDNEYITVSSIEQLFVERDIDYLKREIRKLEFQEKKGTLTDAQQWELESLRDELEELQN